MAVVAGVDFGTLSVRVSMVDSERGLLASAFAEYPLHRKREDPEYATQSHDDHMAALAAATRQAIAVAGISRAPAEALPLHTTRPPRTPVCREAGDRGAGRPAVGRFPDVGGPFARRRARQARWRVRDLRPDCGKALAHLGGKTRIEAGHPDSRRRL